MAQRLYTMIEARLMLGIDHKTLNDWCTKAGIIPVRSEDDHRVKCLTTTQIAQLAHRHQRSLSPAAIQRSPILQAIMRRLELMEHLHSQKDERIAELESQITELKEGKILPYRPRPHTTTHREQLDAEDLAALGEHFDIASRQPRPGQDAPVSKRESARIAVDHGANTWMAALDWQWPPEARQSRETVVKYTRLYLASHPRAGRFHPCQNDAECICHTLIPSRVVETES